MQRRMDYMASKPKQNCITQFQICGDSYQSALVAIVIPDEDVVKQWAADSGDASLSGLDVKTLCKTEALKACIMNEIKTYAKKNGLHGFETPREQQIVHPIFNCLLEIPRTSFHSGVMTPPPAEKINVVFRNSYDDR